jgi:hypothetical protein
MLENRAATNASPKRRGGAINGKPTHNRAATTNDPMRARTNGRTSAGRRVRDLYQALLNATGRIDDIACAQALAAAELVAAAENARTKLLAGQGDIEQIVRLENLANRAVRRLGIQPGAAAPQLSMRDRLIAEAEARDEAEAEASAPAATAVHAEGSADGEARMGGAVVPSDSGGQP